jgi:hypothetical protein
MSTNVQTQAMSANLDALQLLLEAMQERVADARSYIEQNNRPAVVRVTAPLSLTRPEFRTNRFPTRYKPYTVGLSALALFIVLLLHKSESRFDRLEPDTRSSSSLLYELMI